MNEAQLSFIKQDVCERFLRYVQFDTQADPNSATKNAPSTSGQLQLLEILHKELLALGFENSEFDPQGYVYAYLESNIDKQHEALTLLAHVDTAPDCSGKNVKPRLIKNYQGDTISYPDNAELQLTSIDAPALGNCIGDDIIVASGQTLLSADDKAGVAEIMTLLACYKKFPELPHPEIRICFTSDEEIGQGINGINFEKLSKRCLTLDGGDPAELEYECFDAWAFKLHFVGISTHPGTAYKKMVNALSIAAEFVSLLPKTERPETTKDRQGFYHPISLEGNLEEATITGIIRDFDSAKNQLRIKHIKELCFQLEKQNLGLIITSDFRQQYQNMYEILKSEEPFLDLCRKAIKSAGLTSLETPIRGGTDGALLSFAGYPCPNIGSGQDCIHSLKEWTSVGRLSKCVEILIKLSEHYVEQN